jgi:hypothetical protein
VDSAVAGTTTLSTDADVTLTTTVDAANTSRQAILLCTGARTTIKTVTAPAQSKTYTVINATTGGFSVKVVGAGPTAGVTIVNGETAQIAWNGSDFVKVAPPGVLILLATVTPTVAANVDFLNTFSSAYDNYVVLGDGINLSTDSYIAVQLAVTGTADGGSNYVTLQNGSASVSTTQTSFTFSPLTRTAGLGCNFQLLITNANDAVRIKSIFGNSVAGGDVGPPKTYGYEADAAAYTAANVVTGFRLLVISGYNFAAGGSVRVYGYKNS